MRRFELIASGMAVLAATAPATAAVRHCQERISIDGAAAKTEFNAKRSALADWVAKAGAHGVGYAQWRLAFDKRMDCARKADGQVACLVAARPCTIKYVVPQEGAPLKRGSAQ